MVLVMNLQLFMHFLLKSQAWKNCSHAHLILSHEIHQADSLVPSLLLSVDIMIYFLACNAGGICIYNFIVFLKSEFL